MADYRSSLDQQNDKAFGFGATMDQANKLRDMLTQKQEFAQQQQQPFELAKQKAQLGQEEQERNTKVAQDIMADQAKGGRKVNAKIGDVTLSEAEDSPLKYLMRSQQGGAKAQQHAFDTYMKGVPEVQKRMQSASEGLDAVNDPKQIGSIGQAKTLMIKNLGMNRYNQQEGNALVPSQLGGIVHQIFNSGTDGEMNPLTPSQRQALNTVFQGSLQIAKKQHELTKQNALGSYMHSGYADPGVAQQFKSSVGQDMDKQISDLEERYKNVPNTGGFQPSAAPQPLPGMLDKLKGLFSKPAAAPQQQGAAPMSFEEFKAKKAAGQL